MSTDNVNFTLSTLTGVAAPRRSFDPQYTESENRYKWNSKYDLFFICTALCVSYGTTWRFAALVYKHGLAVIVSYAILYCIFAYSLLFMDLTLGQYYSRGPYNVFKLCPLLEGVGFSMILWCLFSTIYVVYIMAHEMYLMTQIFANLEQFVNQTLIANRTSHHYLEIYTWKFSHGKSSTYFNYMFAFCIFVAWLIVYIAATKKIETKRKFIKFVFTIPFIILIKILIINMIRRDLLSGYRYLFKPKLDKFLDKEIWFLGLQQVLYGLGIGTGITIQLGSYNGFFFKDHKRNIILICIAIFLANILSAFIITSNLSRIQNVTGEIYPVDIQTMYFKILRGLPAPEIWTLIFIILLVISGITTISIMVEVPRAAIEDNISTAKIKHRIVWAYCSICGIMSFMFCIEDVGQDIANAVDYFVYGKCPIYLEFFAVVAVIYCYGAKNFRSDLQFMLGKKPSTSTTIIWFLTPVIFLIIMITEWMSLQFVVNVLNIFGLIFFFTILLPIIVFGIKEIYLHRRHEKRSRLLRRISNFGPENQVNRDVRSSISLDNDLDDTDPHMKFSWKWFCCKTK